MKNMVLILVPLIIVFCNNVFSQTEQSFIEKAKQDYENKNYSSAISNYQKALKINPNNEETYMNIAGTYLVQRDLEKFQNSLLDGIKVNPNYEEFYFFFGQGSAMMDKPDDAIKIFQEKNDDNTNWGALCGGIASVYEKMGDLDEAIKYLGKGLKTTKYAHQIYTQMGKLYSQYKGNYMKALEYFNRALEYDSTYPKAYYEIGQIYSDQNEWRKAKGYFEKAIIYDSKYAAAYFNLGACYGNMGDDFLAIENIKKAAELGLKGAKNFLKNNHIK